MINQPLVSICIPVFNGGRYLKDAIKSCLHQDYLNFEIILVDNNSTDNTLEIINSYAFNKLRVYRNRRRLTAQENFNLVISHANGKYFILLPHDDLLEPFALSKLSQRLESNSCASFAFGPARRIDECSNEVISKVNFRSGYFKGEQALNYILSDFPPFQHVMVRRSSVIGDKCYKEYYGNYADVHLYTKLACTKGGFEAISEICTSIREHAAQGQVVVNNLSSKKSKAVSEHHGDHSYKTLQLRGNVNLVTIRYIKYVLLVIESNDWSKDKFNPLLVNIYIKNFLGQLKVGFLNCDLYLLNLLIRNFKVIYQLFRLNLITIKFIKIFKNKLFAKISL